MSVFANTYGCFSVSRWPIGLVPVLATIALVLGATVARAQLQPIADQSGPTIALTADATYDSNVARSSALLASQRGLVPEDEVYHPGLQLNATTQRGADVFYLAGSAGYRFYQTNAVLNAADIGLGAGAHREAGHCKVRADGT